MKLRSVPRDIAVASLFCVVALLISYRVQIASGGQLLSGDLIDARIAITLEEHWYNVLRGYERWNSPLFFMPSSDALGYNDGYFLHGLVFAALRWCGVDPFLAYECVGAVFRCLLFSGVFVFVSRVLTFEVYWAVIASSLVTIASPLYLQGIQTQLLSIGLLPWLAILIHRCIAACAAGRRARAMAAASALAVVFGALVMTAFYVAWFFALAAAIAAGSALGVYRQEAHAFIRWNLNKWTVVPCAVLLLSLAPSVIVYLPKARETGMRAYSEAVTFIPSVLDAVHVGAGNFMFGWLDAGLTRLLRPGFPNYSDHTIGISPILLLLSVIACFDIYRGWRHRKPAWVLALVFSVSLLISARVGTYSLWHIVYAVVPGAGAIRVVARYYLLIHIMAVMLTVLLLRSKRIVWGTPVVWLLVAGLVGEELTANSIIKLDRLEERSFVRSVPVPPGSCRSMYVSSPRTIRDLWDVEVPLLPNVDGMLLAELRHLPTSNGHASFLPAGFAMRYAGAAPLGSGVDAAFLIAGIERDLCGLDLAQMRWSASPIAAELVSFDSDVSVGQSAGHAGTLLAGWSTPEPNGRWTDGRVAYLGFRVPKSEAAITLSMLVVGLRGGGSPTVVDATVHGHPVARWEPAPQEQWLQARIARADISPDGDVVVRLEVKNPVVPRIAGLGDDTRSLGLFLKAFRVTADGDDR